MPVLHCSSQEPGVSTLIPRHQPEPHSAIDSAPTFLGTDLEQEAPLSPARKPLLSCPAPWLTLSFFSFNSSRIQGLSATVPSLFQVGTGLAGVAGTVLLDLFPWPTHPLSILSLNVIFPRRPPCPAEVGLAVPCVFPQSPQLPAFPEFTKLSLNYLFIVSPL